MNYIIWGYSGPESISEIAKAALFSDSFPEIKFPGEMVMEDKDYVEKRKLVIKTLMMKRMFMRLWMI